MEGIISALIAGATAIIGVIITNMSSNKKIETNLATAQAITDTKLEALTEEVRRHNNFASRLPIVEEQIRGIQNNIQQMDKRIYNLEQDD